MSIALDMEGMLLLLLLDQKLTQPYLLVMYLSFIIGKLAMLAGTYATTGASTASSTIGGTRG